MNDRGILQRAERAAMSVILPADRLDDLVRRRDRKQRHQRIIAGSVGMAVFLVVVLISASVWWLDRAETSLGPQGPSWVTDFLDPRTNGQPVDNLFEVEADDAEYWRMFTLDRYDGHSWTSTDADGSHGVLVSGVTLPGSSEGPPPGAETLNQTFRILGNIDGAQWLPMAQTAEEIAGSIGTVRWGPARSQAFVEGGLTAGMEYTVRSRIAVPTPEQLDRVDHLAPSEYGRWTALPADLDPRIARIAERWTADAGSDYRKVLAIQERFHGGDFVYRTDVDSAVDDDALLEFLTQTRAGFCQHYASAMAVMVRTIGLPARVALGYRAGTRQDDGSYLVTTGDVHSWVEVLFPGYGWLQFEPEPGPTPHPNAQPGTYLNPIPR